MSVFIFDSYEFDDASQTARFNYALEDGRKFQESVVFAGDSDYDTQVLDRAMFLAFVIVGISYYKTFPTREVMFRDHAITQPQADFFNLVYQEGLSQYAYENNLTRSQLARFIATSETELPQLDYAGEGTIVLESGGKDSLLLTSLLQGTENGFTPWYVTNTTEHPRVLDVLGSPLAVARRTLDSRALQQSSEDGGKNGHVPVTYIMQSLALIQAILLGKNTVVVSIAHEGEEPHGQIGDLAVNHQWSKTWGAEQAFASYVNDFVASKLRVGSPLRQFSEMKVAELFVRHAWDKYGHEFSSCNVANYRQGHVNSTLSWCGKCPKCANSYLLFAPFLDASELQSLFGGKDMYAEPLLVDTFKGLLGIDGVMKPFECVGEIDELRLAYHMALERGGYNSLPFEVPASSFDYQQTYPAQAWATTMIQ